MLLATTLVETSRLGGFLSRALLFVLGPIAAAFTHALLSPRREYAPTGTRRASATRTTSPTRCSGSTAPRELVSFAASPATEPLYTVDPFETDRLSRMFRTHPPLAERVRRLRALDADASGAGRAGVPDAPDGAGEPLRNEERATLSCGPLLELIRRRPTLPGALAPSTIGAGGLNFSVRNGKRCTPAAMTAESVKGGTRPPAARPKARRREVERRSYLQNSIATQNMFKIKTSGN